MAILPLPKEKQGSFPSRSSVSHSINASRDESEREAVSDDSNSEEEEKYELKHECIEQIREMVSDMAKV